MDLAMYFSFDYSILNKKNITKCFVAKCYPKQSCTTNFSFQTFMLFAEIPWEARHDHTAGSTKLIGKKSYKLNNLTPSEVSEEFQVNMRPIFFP